MQVLLQNSSSSNLKLNDLIYRTDNRALLTDVLERSEEQLTQLLGFAPNVSSPEHSKDAHTAAEGDARARLEAVAVTRALTRVLHEQLAVQSGSDASLLIVRSLIEQFFAEFQLHESDLIPIASGVELSRAELTRIASERQSSFVKTYSSLPLGRVRRSASSKSSLSTRLSRGNTAASERRAAHVAIREESENELEKQLVDDEAAGPAAAPEELVTDIIAWLNSPSLAIFIETHTQYLATRALLSQLREFVLELLGGTCPLIVVCGSSGVGKSVLIECAHLLLNKFKASAARLYVSSEATANASQSSSSNVSTVQYTKVEFTPITASKIYPERFSNEEIFGFSTSEGYVLS